MTPLQAELKLQQAQEDKEQMHARLAEAVRTVETSAQAEVGNITTVHVSLMIAH